MAAKTCVMAEKRCHGSVSKQCTPPVQTEGQGSQGGLKPSGIVGRRGPSWWAYGTRVFFLGKTPVFTYAHPFPTLPRMSRRYAITKVVARYRVRLVRNPDPTAERGSGNRKVPRFIHDPTDGKQSQRCPSNVAFGKPLPLGATQNRCPSGQRCPSNVASGKPFPLGETQNRCPSGQRKTVAP